MSSSSASLGLLLRIEPKQLEQQFWQSTDTLRMLCAMDMLGFAMVLPNVWVAMTGRVNTSLPEGVVLPEGAKIILLLYWVVAALPVAVMLWNFQSYRRHRTKLAVVSRAYRLVSTCRTSGIKCYTVASTGCLPGDHCSQVSLPMWQPRPGRIACVSYQGHSGVLPPHACAMPACNTTC
jgi:hypothetical protein